jgi:myo-inositol-1(or 4)-monophosphatase
LALRSTTAIMKELLLDISAAIHDAIRKIPGHFVSRYANRRSHGGDAQFGIDELAEQAVSAFLERCDIPIALHSEDQEFRIFGGEPEYLLVVDPIDGTRPAAAGLETATISIAAAPFTPNAKPRIRDVEYGLLREIATGRVIYGERTRPGIEGIGFPHTLAAARQVTNIEEMFWSLEFNGHPAALMTAAYGHLIDRSANTGAVFVFNSASWSISRIITGQLDAYVDIGNRLLRDHPPLRQDFERVGGGKVLHLFPYDIAASVFLAEKAGITITDGYGKSLQDTPLLSVAEGDQQSCIAASTPELHQRILREIDWAAPSRSLNKC